jgi:uncharacterized OB-fold protein
MTETAEAKKPLIEEFKAMTTKQWAAIFAAFAICAALVLTGIYAALCLGFFLIAVILYMVPHLLGVTSPKIKAVIGVTFIVVILVLGTFAYGGSARDMESGSATNVILKDVTFEDGVITIVSDQAGLDIDVAFAPVTEIAFGHPSSYNRDEIKHADVTYSDGKYTSVLNLDQGKYYFIEVSAPLNEEKSSYEYYMIFKNTGLTDPTGLNFMGAFMLVCEVGLIFFVMLVFSELMRRSARKSREKMEKDGRLYPKGYSKCPQCGTMVLPGEINCRKCGTPIEVPDDVKVLHKKDFFKCSECGTEVPNDAKVCPKCGALFDEEDEVEIKHADGTVDVSNESFECSECGKKVPANAKRCPYCGADFDEEDD